MTVTEGISDRADRIYPGLVAVIFFKHRAKRAIAADQFSHARRNGFGPFRILAQDQDRFAHARRFFLHTARIRRDQPRIPHQADKIRVIQRFEQVNPLVSREYLVRNAPDIRVRVDREQKADILVAKNEVSQCQQVTAHFFAKTLAAVRC